MRTTQLTRRIRAPRTSVYRALVDPLVVQQWMVPDHMTSHIHTFDARMGGSFRITLTYDRPITRGKTDPQTDVFQGRFVELVPDTKVVQSVQFESDDSEMKGEMTITYLLSDATDGTDIVATHENLPPGLSLADNEIGWRMAIDKLAELLEPHD